MLIRTRRVIRLQRKAFPGESDVVDERLVGVS